MAVLEFDFKQSYNIDSLLIQDLSVYNDRDSVYQITVKIWDYYKGSDESEVPLNEIYTAVLSYTDADWEENWTAIQSGFYLHASRFNLYTIPDGIYYIQVEVETTEAPDDFIAPFGFYQETENAYINQHLEYDWTKRFREDPESMYEIAKVSNWFQALELSIRPGSLIGNFRDILLNLRKYLKLD